MNSFLDESYGRSVNITDYFPVGDKFVKSVKRILKSCGLDVLDEKKRYRLKKHVTNISRRDRLVKINVRKKVKSYY